MKFFTLIMSMYLVLLSSLPCGDSKECNAQEEQKISAAADHQEHNHTNESCTPFCNCACCSSPVFCQSLININNPIVDFQVVKFPYETPVYSYDHKTIRQPPKIS